MKKILFVNDPLEELKFPWDTTSFLAAECQRQKLSVFFSTPEELFWDKGKVWGFLRQAKINPFKGAARPTPSRPLPLSQMDVVWMRKDPPINPQYHQTCQLLRLLPSSILVLNNPETLILKNEKLFPLEFPHWTPKTIVTKSLAQLRQFLKEQKGEMVVKPVANRGGRGVQLIRSSDTRLKQKLLKLTSDGKDFIIAQKFLPQALTKGDKRIVLLDGKPMGAFVRPPNPQTLTGKPLPFVPDRTTEITPKEKKLCRELAPLAKKLGLFFLGIDVIAEQLIEINLTSPAGIPELDKLYGGNHAKIMINAMRHKFFRGKQ